MGFLDIIKICRTQQQKKAARRRAGVCVRKKRSMKRGRRERRTSAGEKCVSSLTQPSREIFPLFCRAYLARRPRPSGLGEHELYLPASTCRRHSRSSITCCVEDDRPLDE